MIQPVLLPGLALTGLFHTVLGTDTVTGSLPCRPEGPIVPPPLRLTTSTTFQQVTSDLTAALDGAVRGEIKAGFPMENTSFSLGLVSLSQTDPGIPLWEYHHLSPDNVNGTKVADRDSQYLIGSISKVVTDAIAILSGIDVELPITHYLPELDSESSPISWKNITVKALMSQLSGIPPNYGFSEYYFLKDVFESLGFPHLEDSDYAQCGITGLNAGCTKEEFLQGMLTVRPIAPPMTRPVYSNIAFQLVAYAVEAATSQNYTAQLRDLLTTPLGMSSTLPSPGNDSRAVIPSVPNTWGGAYGDGVPGGGLVSTLADLSRFSHAILTRTLFPAPARVRKWLQPRSLAGAPGSLVGAPWEIFVPPTTGPHALLPHTVSIYAKGGGAYGYNSQLAVVPQYGVALVLLTAGNPRALFALYDTLLSAFIPAVDAAAREEAVASGLVGGSFVSAGCEPGTGACVNLTLSQDAASLRLAALTRGGADILAAAQVVWAATLGAVLGDGLAGATLRVFPTDVASPGTLAGGREVVLEDWRLWWDFELEDGETELPSKGLPGQDCLLWSFADWIYYGGEPVDRLVFVRDVESGEVVGAEVPFLRSGLLERGV